MMPRVVSPPLDPLAFGGPVFSALAAPAPRPQGPYRPLAGAVGGVGVGQAAG